MVTQRTRCMCVRVYKSAIWTYEGFSVERKGLIIHTYVHGVGNVLAPGRWLACRESRSLTSLLDSLLRGSEWEHDDKDALSACEHTA